MNRAVKRNLDRTEAGLLDEETWDNPGRLTDSDLFAHAGPGWRRGYGATDDMEDDR